MMKRLLLLTVAIVAVTSAFSQQKNFWTKTSEPPTNKQLQAVQDKLDKGASVLADAARASLQAEIEKQQRDIQRFTEDAQQEIMTLTQQLQADFERLLMPVIEKVAKEKQVHFVFDAAQSGLVWADPSMNLTADVIQALDAGGTAKPAAAPAAAVPPK